jgi:GTP-binding protein EngB required for normal cell division
MSIRKKVLVDVRSLDDTFDGEYLESCLSKGSFEFILNRLDEVKPDKREQIEREIMEVADKYPDNKMILFTRPASSVEGWDEFKTMSVRGLTREKAIELVKNVRRLREVPI